MRLDLTLEPCLFYSREPLNSYHHVVLSSLLSCPQHSFPFLLSCHRRRKWVWKPGDLISVKTSRLIIRQDGLERWWHLGQRCYRTCLYEEKRKKIFFWTWCTVAAFNISQSPELSATMELFGLCLSALFDVVTTGRMWLLNTWAVANAWGTELLILLHSS